ncbi:glycosyl hydrolase family 28-related protein [Paenibacillus sp. NPDC093718]|uniref:glycosyl hydrolase family 28-related protein n=1 Tax=Paenibacillus sp. NPDC093718 TaxID=3390601 RepID=UPI003CFE7C1E
MSDLNYEDIFYKDAIDRVSTVISALGKFHSEVLVNIKDFGARGDGSDDTDAIQRAEDYASKIKCFLCFPPGRYKISKPIIKKSLSQWRGINATIYSQITNGVSFSLVVASRTSDWSIDGLSFEAIDHATFEAKGLTASFGTVGLSNACIDAYCSTRFLIQNCLFRRFSQGILYRGCTQFEIVSNKFYSDNGKTLDSMQSKQYSKFLRYAYTGAIVFAYKSGYENQKASDFLISRNYIEVPGLDIGIDGLAQTPDENPGLIQSNIIKGAHCGIQVYRGSFNIPSNSPTFRANLLIQNNRICLTWEQGIYIRTCIGVQVNDNYLEMTGLSGTSRSGASVGGIVTRADAFGNFPNYFSASPDVPVTISNNYIINPGSISDLDGAIQIRVSYCHVMNNIIIKEKDKFPNRSGNGILVDNGEGIIGSVIFGNKVKNHNSGIRWIGTLKSHDSNFYSRVEHNIIEDCALGIYVDSYRTNSIKICSNFTQGCSVGITIKNSPYTSCENNTIANCIEGIQLGAGNLASDYLYLKSGGIIPTSKGRAGGTLIVKNNEFTNTATSHSITNTIPGDIHFFGRCIVWKGDVVDGTTIEIHEVIDMQEKLFSVKTWNKGDIISSTSIIKGAPYKKICVTGGTYGTYNLSETGNINAGSKVISNVSNIKDVGKWMILSVNGEVRKVIDIDYNSRTIIMDSPFSATINGASILFNIPTWIEINLI